MQSSNSGAGVLPTGPRVVVVRCEAEGCGALLEVDLGGHLPPYGAGAQQAAVVVQCEACRRLLQVHLPPALFAGAEGGLLQQLSAEAGRGTAATAAQQPPRPQLLAVQRPDGTTGPMEVEEQEAGAAAQGGRDSGMVGLDAPALLRRRRQWRGTCAA